VDKEFVERMRAALHAGLPLFFLPISSILSETKARVSLLLLQPNGNALAPCSMVGARAFFVLKKQTANFQTAPFFPTLRPQTVYRQPFAVNH